MRISLPYSRDRRYLTGIDWVVAAMDHDALRQGGAGAISQAVLHLRGVPDAQHLTDALTTLSARFPLLHGRVARDWLNLAPYWKAPASPHPHAMKLHRLSLPDTPQGDLAVMQALADHVNTPMSHRHEHVRFLLIEQVGRSHLGMAFDHKLLDAYGAEAFLRLIDLTAQGRLDDIAPQVRQTEPAHLDRWKQRFARGRVLSELFHTMRTRPVRALAMPDAPGPRRVAFVHDALSVQESAAFNERAGKEIGLPITLPSAAARAVLALRRTFPQMPLAGEHDLLFTTVTARTPGQEWASLFFNPFAFLAFAGEPDIGPHPAELAMSMRDQLFDYMKADVPAAMHDAAMLGRIFPRSWVSRVSRAIGGGRLCSLYFACLRETGYPGETGASGDPGGMGDAAATFLGVPIDNLVHTPLAFCPPGVNLCMTWFAGRFNLVLAYVAGVMSDAQAREMLAHFKASLLE